MSKLGSFPCAQLPSQSIVGLQARERSACVGTNSNGKPPASLLALLGAKGLR
jgi:hypothetical protein